MNFAIGIDIGGTKIAIGIVDQQGGLKAQTTLPTDLSISPDDMITAVATATIELLAAHGIPNSSIIGLGIGAPGPIDTKKGVIVEPPNLRSWWNFNIIDSFKRYFDYPIFFENDATAAALAEKWLGAAQDAEHFIFMTISTGIGAGIFTHGKLLTGATGNAGDIGHIVIDPGAGHCNCGQDGCFEYIASGTAIARQASEILGRSVTSKEVFELAAGGHTEMKSLVDKVFHYIAVGCVTLINTFDPERIVIGGGVSQVGASLFDTIQQYVSKNALNPSGRNTPIIPAQLQQNAGLIGAAALVHVSY